MHYPFLNQTPIHGEVIEMLPSIRWVRMPLPFALDHINLWLLRDQRIGPSGVIDGWAVVDCCISSDAAKQHWQQIFNNHLEGLPVLRVIVTHMHPDHVGLAYWLCDLWSTPDQPCHLWMSATDHHLALLYSQSVNTFSGKDTVGFFSKHGWCDQKSLELLSEREGYYRALVPNVPRSFTRLIHNQVLRIGEHDWRCIVGFGHAPEHMSLYCESLGLLISGDMVLPRISTNVSVYELEPEADSLTLFLDSLELFLTLPENTLVLPSHGLPFVGLHERIGQLKDHHRERLSELLVSCEQSPRCAHDVLGLLFKRTLDFHQTTFAMGEAVAHLHRLWRQGKLERYLDDHGIYRFRVKKYRSPTIDHHPHSV